jgi:hypothetical protein
MIHRPTLTKLNADFRRWPNRNHSESWKPCDTVLLQHPPNLLTLSCKSRLLAGLTAAWWPPRLNEHRRERSAAAMPPCSSEPPEAAPPPAQGVGGFCQLVRAVRPLWLFDLATIP